MTTTMTARQKQVLDFIHTTVEDRGYAPSFREISAHLRITGTRAVEKHLAALEKKGFLKKGVGARALGPTGRSVGRVVPVLGRVAAGAPILAEENIERTITLDPALARWTNVFCLRVKGDSMTGAAIMNNDLVIVRPQSDADSGEIVVALHDGEATVKRLRREAHKVFLMPENPAYQPIPVDAASPFTIVGKVVGVLRMF